MYKQIIKNLRIKLRILSAHVGIMLVVFPTNNSNIIDEDDKKGNRRMAARIIIRTGERMNFRDDALSPRRKTRRAFHAYIRTAAARKSMPPEINTR